ncbi:Soluble NSF attachment protein [Harpegnathos saltator]|uniref:Soluble NSF attachment protein n=1 Tax=Harpegnathos saltator TaxID=610380 RepID=E2BXF9_HARSA|nr:Soluble NSF attachment protein [Harpegnathos saltator]
MADNEQKALQLVAEAERKLSSSRSFFGSLFGSSSKVEEAVECYHRAANMFKMAKKWSSAGKAFYDAADLHAKAGSRHDAANNYVDAANCFKKSDTNEAISCLLKAIEIYTDMGRFTMAAKHHQSIAEIYESEAVDLERAVATASLESSLLKYSAKEYFFRAALCHLCIDALNAQHAIERYQEQYPAFQDSREYKLIMTLIEHLEEQNLEGFTEAVKEYDSISRLDQWYTTVLLRIKKQVNDNPDLR